MQAIFGLLLLTVLLFGGAVGGTYIARELFKERPAIESDYNS